MKTISKNVLLFALLVCCNQTIKSAAAAAVEYQEINPAIMEFWLIQLQEAEKDGVLDMKKNDPEAFSRLIELILTIEVAKRIITEDKKEGRKVRVIAQADKRVNTLIEELSKKLGKETEKDKKEQRRKLLREQKREMLRSDLSGSNENLDLIKKPLSFELFRGLYRNKVLPHLDDQQFDLCMLSPEEQKAHVESLRKDQQKALLESLERPYEESNAFFGGMQNLLPTKPGKFVQHVSLADGTAEKICKPLNISSLYKSLRDAIYPPSQYK